MVAPLALAVLASVGYLTHNFVLQLLLALACVVVALIAGVMFAVVYRPRAANRRPPSVETDLAALDALEPLRAERPDGRP